MEENCNIQKLETNGGAPIARVDDYELF